MIIYDEYLKKLSEKIDEKITEKEDVPEDILQNTLNLEITGRELDYWEKRNNDVFNLCLKTYRFRLLLEVIGNIDFLTDEEILSYTEETAIELLDLEMEEKI